MDTYESTWFAERRGYVRCRTIGHSWFDYDSNWETSMGYPLTLRCERCGTERRDVIGTYGQLVSRHYHKPENYDLTPGEERLNRSDFRLILMELRNTEPQQKRKRA